jgi:hypothetical protein
MIKNSREATFISYFYYSEINANNGIKSCSFILEITLNSMEKNFASFQNLSKMIDNSPLKQFFFFKCHKSTK